MTNDRTDSMAFQTLLGDLVESILKYSDNPGACAQYITTQIRELIGVRMVALLSIDERRDCTLVGVCPIKREQEWYQPEIQTFITSVLPNNVPRFIDPATDSEGKSLSLIGIGSSFVIPLIVGSEQVGMLVLLGLMDEAGIKSILKVLTKISSILALILKNSLLYKSLEQRVEERTSALQVKISELKLSEERLDMLAEHSRTIHWEVDAQGLYTFINPVSERVIGYSPEELVGKKHFYDIHPEKERESFKKAAFEVFDQKGSFQNFVNAIQTKSDTLIWVSTNGIPLLNSDGSLHGYRGSDTDITERKAAEDNLAEQKALFEAIFRCIPDAIIYANIDREVVGINPAFTSIFGFDMNDLTGQKTSFFYESPEEYERQGRIRFNMTAAEHALPYEVRYRRKDGSLFPGETLGTVVKDDCGTVMGYIGVIRDITGRKQAEEEKQMLEHQMQHTQKLESLGVLAGGIAHDFNNILAIIIGYCGLIKMNYETARKNIPEIESAAERAAGLCRQMLAYAGKTQLNKTQVNMWAMVDEMVTMLKSTLPRNAVIKPELSGDIPCIIADVSQLRQVVMNLIINASEAIGIEQGEILVSLTSKTVRSSQPDKDCQGKAIPPGRYICLEVTDDGCGMDEETKLRIFEPFYTTKFTGRGLGMSAVLGIVNSHGGALQLFSQQGQGTTFKIYLPVPTSDTAEEENRTPSTPSISWQGSGTILLVEDEEQIRGIAKIMLEIFGFTVLEAVNGKEALELYQKNAADIILVLTDIGMPVMDGYALIPALKQLNPKLLIVISSGFGDVDVTSRIGRDAIAGIISKPYNISQLGEVLKSVMDGS